MITLSKLGLKMLCGFEGFSAQPYKDSGGLWTIGYGTRIPNPSFYGSAGIPEQKASELLDLAVQSICPKIDALHLGLTFSWQTDAIISLVYNIGIGAFQSSATCAMLRQQRSEAIDHWKAWIRDAKKNVQPGLVERREAETRCFIWGKYPT
jgi:lysozyme